MLGANLNAGVNCCLDHSVVGSNCRLGAEVKLEKCVLFDNVSIEDGYVPFALHGGMRWECY